MIRRIFMLFFILLGLSTPFLFAWIAKRKLSHAVKHGMEYEMVMVCIGAAELTLIICGCAVYAIIKNK